MNDRPAFNCGIFQFSIVTRTRHNSSELSEKLTQELDDCNVMVRLFDNAKKDDFCYAFQQIPFGLDNERLEWEIQSFIIEVCKQNVKRLSGTLKSDYSISPERKIASESLVKTMKDAIKMLSPVISKFREQLYKNIYPGTEIAFDEWYMKMRKDPHIISQGKSTCARKVANERSKVHFIRV